jgi:hypothetical protein
MDKKYETLDETRDPSVGKPVPPEVAHRMKPPVRQHFAWYVVPAALIIFLIWLAHLYLY